MSGSKVVDRRSGSRVDGGLRAGRPTMQDVARLAGVSPKTVSRVLNMESAVSRPLEERVEKAVATLGYRLNSTARSLRTGVDSSSIGLVIADLLNPFYAHVAKAVETVADRHGCMVVIASSGEDPKREQSLVLAMLARPVDGVIVVPAGQDHRYLEGPRRLGAAVVFVDRPPSRITADAVVLDNLGGSRLAVEHLIAQGHRRIGFVGDSATLSTLKERLTGYSEALAGAGIAYDPELVKLGSRRVELAEAAATQLLGSDDPPTAIFAENNRNCVGVIRAVWRAQRPVAVAAFDDLELADELRLPLTLVTYDAEEIGRTAAETLFARLGGDSRPPSRIVIPTRLVIHGRPLTGAQVRDGGTTTS